MRHWRLDEKLGIGKPIENFTTDTTNVMPAMVRELGMRHIPCFAHTLNLVVQDVLKVMFQFFDYA